MNQYEVFCDDGEDTTIFADSVEEAVQTAIERGHKAFDAEIVE